MFSQKVGDLGDLLKEPVAIMGEHYKIISIADIVLCFQMMFYELVKLVHVDIQRSCEVRLPRGKPMLGRVE